MLTAPDSTLVRFQTGDDLNAFLYRPGLTDVRYLSRQQQLEEAWFLGLRLNDGVDRGRLEEEFGHSAAYSYEELLKELTAEGLVEVDRDRVRLTGRGRLLSNEVFARFLRDEAVAEPSLISIQ
jgi:oxygen-independent coproporphyrinogen-3 oxidase